MLEGFIWVTTKSVGIKLEIFFRENDIEENIRPKTRNNEGECEIRSNKNLEELHNETIIVGTF